MPSFPNAVDRALDQKIGESPSVLDFDRYQTCNLGTISTDGVVSADCSRITGGNTRFARAAGLVVNVIVVAGGEGYSAADTVVISGSGTGVAYAPMLSTD